MSSTKRVLIIGGGVIGLSTGYYAARRGHEVTILDRCSADHEGCSYGNAGMVTPSHFVPLAAPGMVRLGLKWMWNPASPFYIKPRLSRDLLSWGWKFCRSANASHVARSAPLLRDLSFASRACFEEFAALSGNAFGLTTRGLIMLCKSDHALEEEAKMAEQANQLGVPAEVLGPKETAALDPAIRMDVAGGVYFPKDCHLMPGRFMAFLKEELQRLGVRICWNTEALGFAHEEGRIRSVSTPSETFTADEYVVCAGSWTPSVVRDLGIHLPMQAGKGYSLTLSAPPRLPGICAILTEARIAVTPMGTSLRFGGTMEIAGMNEAINPIRVEGIIRGAMKYYPEFREEHFRGIPPWSGLRPCSPDGLPYVGRAPGYGNLSIAAGHAMMGLTLGPITGKLIAEILSGEKPSIDIRLLDPARWDRPSTGSAPG